MPQYTLSVLQEKVYSHLENNTDLYPAAEVTHSINEALQTLNLFTGYLEGSVVLGNTEANRVFYDIPSTILFPEALYLSNRRLSPTPLPTMAMQHKDWLRHTTANFGSVRHWIPLGINKFAIHPADAVGGRQLKMEGILEVTPLVAGADVVTLADQLADAVQNLAAHVLMLKEGGKVFADASMQYQGFLHDMKEMERWKTLRHPRYFIEKEAQKVPA